MSFIEYYPNSPLPPPLGPIVDQRAQKIAEIYKPMVSRLQLASRLITTEEILPGFKETDVYGVVGEKLSDGDKSMLYRPEFSAHQLGKVVRSRRDAIEYAEELFDQGDYLRAKDPTGTNGQGQHTVKDLKFLNEVMNQALSSAEDELLLMPYVNIEQQVSVGRFRVGEQQFNYVGEEFSKPDGQFGGGNLAIMRHGISEEQRLAAAERLGIQPRILALGDWALDTYAKIESIRYVGRNSVDVIQGTTTSGRSIIAVTDVSPRVSGHTLTEAIGARTLSANPDINVVHATGKAYMDPKPGQYIPGRRIIDLGNYIATVDIEDAIA